MQTGQGGTGGDAGQRRRRGGQGRSRRAARGRKRGNRPRNRPRGYCVCPACGLKVPLYTDVPCYIMNCSKCGATMVKDRSKAGP